MPNKLEKLQSKAFQFVWPVIATAAVIAGGYAAHHAVQAEKAENPVEAAFATGALLFCAAFAAHTKGVHQSCRDKKLGILDKDGDTKITSTNFVTATNRYKDLAGQANMLTVVSASSIVVAGVVPAALGAGLVLASICSPTTARRLSLCQTMKSAADAITEDPHNNPTDALAAARSFLSR